jgi:hypothetical protein
MSLRAGVLAAQWNIFKIKTGPRNRGIWLDRKRKQKLMMSRPPHPKFIPLPFLCDAGGSARQDPDSLCLTSALPSWGLRILLQALEIVNFCVYRLIVTLLAS